MRTKILTTLIAIFSCAALSAQDHGHHHHARNEIGVSTGAVYGFGHREWGTGLHLHYFRTFTGESRWSFGGGVEQAWMETLHFNVGAGIKVQLLDRLSVSLLPGVTFVSHEGHDPDPGHESSESLFTLHGEVVYDIFHWNDYHLGVVADYSWAKDDRHGMLGVHAAWCF